jgi:hypothetical protein
LSWSAALTGCDRDSEINDSLTEFAQHGAGFGTIGPHRCQPLGPFFGCPVNLAQQQI